MSHHWRRNHYGSSQDCLPPVSSAPPMSSAVPVSSAPPLFPGYARSPSDPRSEAWQQQLAQLQRQLASERRATAQLAAEHRRQTQSQQTALKQWETERTELRQRIEQLVEKVNVGQVAKDQIPPLRSALATQQSQLASHSNTINSLKTELHNVALAAAAEYTDLTKQHQSEQLRLRAELGQKEEQVQRLNKREERLVQERSDWEAAHQSAVSLADWIAHELEKSQGEIKSLQDDFDSYRESTAEAAAVFDAEYETLEDTLSMMRTDHEAVELLCDQLSHQCDRLEMQSCDVYGETEELAALATRNQEESNRSIQALRSQLVTMQLKLDAVTGEKQSLIESLSQLKQNESDFDAALFAKDQELDATQRLSDETQRQLKSLLREHQVIVSRNDQLRNQTREATGEISELESKLQEASAERDQLREALAVRANELKEVQSSARAAEANAVLRQGETEQSFSIQRETLEAEVERLEEDVLRYQAELQQRAVLAQEELTEDVVRLEAELQLMRDELRQRDHRIAELSEPQGAKLEVRATEPRIVSPNFDTCSRTRIATRSYRTAT